MIFEVRSGLSKLMTLTMMILCLSALPQYAFAQNWGAFAEGFREGRKEQEQRRHERELLEMRLQHERDMLAAQQMQQNNDQASRQSPSINTANTSVLKGIDFFGGDITASGFKGVSINTCIQICVENASCVAVTYVESSSWCFPKNPSYISKANSGVVSMRLR